MQVNNLNINYIKEGKGDFVFILHGWGSSSQVFQNTKSLMAQKYTVVVPDIPGFGDSDEPKEPWCVDNYVDFVIDFISQFKAQKVILMGHSYGGRIMIKLANRKNLPFELDKLILVDAAGIKAKLSLKSKIKVKLFKLAKYLLPQNLVVKLRNKMGSSDYNNASPIMKQTMVKSIAEDLSPLLKGIKTETLLIWGKDDTATPLSDGQLMEKEIKNSGLVVLEGGHYSFLDSQFVFNKVIKSFLKIGDK
ncbi:MAG: alpha/beta hydrolase [Alphaproteobacteria bacterium]